MSVLVNLISYLLLQAFACSAFMYTAPGGSFPRIHRTEFGGTSHLKKKDRLSTALQGSIGSKFKSVISAVKNRKSRPSTTRTGQQSILDTKKPLLVVQQKRVTAKDLDEPSLLEDETLNDTGPLEDETPTNIVAMNDEIPKSTVPNGLDMAKLMKQQQLLQELISLEEEVGNSVIEDELHDQLDLSREQIRLESFEGYILVSVLTATSSFGTLEQLPAPEEAGMEAWHATIQAVSCASALLGMYSCVIFTLIQLYGKTAIGMNRDAMHDYFLNQTGNIRIRGFKVCILVLSCLSLHDYFLTHWTKRLPSSRSVCLFWRYYWLAVKSYRPNIGIPSWREPPLPAD
jgi:hypothetical protein